MVVSPNIHQKSGWLSGSRCHSFNFKHFGSYEIPPRRRYRFFTAIRLFSERQNCEKLSSKFGRKFQYTLRLHGMSWGVKTTCFKAPGMSLGGSGVSIGGVRILRVVDIFFIFPMKN